MATLNYAAVLIKYVLTLTVLFQASISAAEPKDCTAGDFGNLLLQCNENKTRSIVPYMRRQCVPKGTYFPKIINGLPCECKPGLGIKITTKPRFSWSCVKCKAGNYSVGGMVIDTWERWNGTLTVPGSGYRFMPFCVTIVKGALCDGWQPSNDFSHLVSSSNLNQTNSASCLEQKNMQTYMAFHSKEEGGNYISFRYKVDGMPCPKTTTDCRKGLTFYVDDKVVLKSDVQFTWRVFKYNLTAQTHIFRWTHVSSCSSRAGSFDVAYVTHVAFVGVSKAHTMCNECPVGTFSSEDGSQECTKCPFGQYQNKTGQTKCIKCPAGTFSHFGDKDCFKLNKCKKSDYRLVPDPISKCYLKDGKPVRNQLVLTPKWPGMDSGPCTHENKPGTITNCTCPSGFSLKPVYKPDGSKDSFECKPCPDGQTMTKSGKCGKCPNGKAAIPGVFYSEWPNGGIPKEFKTECSGSGCPKSGGWLPSGDSITTQRIPGNFETYIELSDLNIKYYRSFITFNCSVDCRINPVHNKLARANDCFLRFSLIRDGKVNVREVDCIKYSRHHQRNGTKMSHYYSISRPGNYTFRWLFHQNDDERTNVLSYEARVYNIRIWGVEKGQAKECISCSAGSEVSKDGTSCEKCPVGTYSPKGIKCERCPENTFTDKVASSKCIPCGANTTSNEARTDCLVNNCQFTAAPGVIYNLMPMANVNGSMIEVKQYPKRGSHIWYRNYFYVNLCTRDHDNTSCTDLQNKLDERGRYIKETVILKTMACKRWSFSSKYSYSIGRVIGFKAKKDVTSGLTVELTDGYNCYNKHSFKMIPAKTIIDLICDIDAGVGVPMPIDNKTAVEMKPCEFHLVWRSLYACPVCQDTKPKEFHTECIKGRKNVTYTPAVNCRNKKEGSHPFTKHNVECHVTKYKSFIPKAVSHIGLVVVIVIFTLLAIALIATVILLLRKNRLYRTQLFSPGTHMKALQEDDLHELIDD